MTIQALERRVRQEAGDLVLPTVVELLGAVYPSRGLVLEIGSGLGQHVLELARQLPWLRWQPSERPRFLGALRLMTATARLPNLLPPIPLDVNQPWPIRRADGLFSANTVHVMPWRAVEALFAGAAAALVQGGCFCLLGPFSRNGYFMRREHRQFDAMLRARDPGLGLRDVGGVDALARAHGFALTVDRTMPDHSVALVWQRR